MYWSLSVPQLSDGTYSVDVQYYHPFGRERSNNPWNSLTQVTSLPDGSSHSVNLNFAF